MSTALPLLNETFKAAKRRRVGVMEVASKQKRIKLPLASVKLSARVADRLAHVTVTQVFTNPFSDPLEAVYIFPLAGGCAVSSFTMKVGERLIEGLVEERQAAREQYTKALEEGKRAALLEQERDDVFTVQVGNLPPGEEVTVILTYSEKLPYYDQGMTEIRLPLVVAPRYIPGTALERDSVGDGVELDTDQVPDASRISPPRLAPGVKSNIDLDINVELCAVETIDDLSCSQHATRMGAGQKGMTVSLARVDELLDRDFVLRWRVATDKLESRFFVYQGTAGSGAVEKGKAAAAGKKEAGKKDSSSKVATGKPVANSAGTDTAGKSGGVGESGEGGDKDYYGMISLMPPIDDDLVRPARDVIFVLDRSGSMEGIKMVSAARACSYLLSTLGPEDRFAIQAFDTAYEWMTAPGGGGFFTEADETGLEAGYKYLRSIGARGGTELQGAMVEAINVMKNRLDKTGRIPVIVVLTDGEVGNEAAIVKYIQQQLGDNSVFTIGIDTAVNDGFLKKLAAIGGGTSAFVEPGVELEEALAHVGREIGLPLVTDLTIEDVNCGFEKDTVAPSKLPDLFEGRAINAFFKLSGNGLKDLTQAKIKIKGKYVDGRDFATEVSATTTDVKSLPQLWARTTVVDLEDQYRLSTGAAQEKLRKRIIDVAVKHSLLTKFTAFVVVDHSEVVNADGLMRKIVQPVEDPHGWELESPMQAQGIIHSVGASPSPSTLFGGGTYGAGAPQMQRPMAGAPMPPAIGGIGSLSKSKDNSSDGWGAPPASLEAPQSSASHYNLGEKFGFSSNAAEDEAEAGSGWVAEPMNGPTPAPPPATLAESIRRSLKRLNDDEIDQLFQDKLGVSKQQSNAMPGSNIPAPSSPPEPLTPAARMRAPRGQSQAAGTGGNAGSETVDLQDSFKSFELVLKETLEAIAAGNLVHPDNLDKARLELLDELARSPLAARLAPLQKYLRSDLVRLIRALLAATKINQKLKDMAADHSTRFDEIVEEFSAQILEESRPFWGMTV